MAIETKLGSSTIYRENLLQGKRTVVTGACEGIGLQVAYTLAELGARVCIMHYRLDNAKQSADLINNKLGDDLAFPVVGDVSDPIKLKDSFARISDEYDSAIDAFISNAGRNYPCRIEDQLTPDKIKELEEMVSINQLGTHYCASYSYPLLINGVNPSFIIIGSCASQGSEGQAGYSETKGALRSLMGTQVKEWAATETKQAVRANLIEGDYFEPTGIRSPEYLEALAASRRTTVDKVANDAVARTKVPVRREGRLLEIAEAVVYLMLAGYVNGDVLTLSGGKTVRL